MAQDKAATGGIKLLRGKQVMFTPPGRLGYHSLERPDQTYNKLQANIHFSGPGLEALGKLIEERCIAPLFSKWQDEFKQPKAKRPDAAEWVADHAKDPKDGKPYPEQFVRFQVAGGGKKKTGEDFVRVMRAWDAKNTLLDLPNLKLGRGSIVQIAVTPGIFANALIKQPQPVFQLVGVRVLKLEQWGAGARVEAFDAEVLDVLGAEFEVEDLSAFAGKRGDNKATTAEVEDTDEPASPF